MNIEKCIIYQVVDFSEKGVFLQNVRNDEVFEVKSLDEEIMNKLDIDTIIIYENGTYTIDEELTEKFMNSMIGIKEFNEIKKKFINESGINELKSSMEYYLQTKTVEYSILTYAEKTIKVPNALIPFFAIEGDKLYYKNGKFNINVEK